MRTAIKLIIVVWLIGGVQAAMADEARDAVQVLSDLWKGTFDDPKGRITTEFVGDGKDLKMRWVAYVSDGSVTVWDAMVPYRFLEIADGPIGGSLGNLITCHPESECVFVRCLYQRECIPVRQNTYDPVYHDPRFLSSGRFQRREVSGAVKPADAESVRQALSTLIRLNAAPPWKPPAPQ
jgi:hypothetical protein